jgi:hypothetical protein
LIYEFSLKSVNGGGHACVLFFDVDGSGRPTRTEVEAGLAAVEGSG